MSPPTRDQILDDLAGMLRDFHGREYSGDIGAEALFFADLGFGAIDAVVLGETLEAFYGRKFPFSQFLADLGRRGARDLRLGELAAFLEREMAV
jgi:hypothetical protein